MAMSNLTTRVLVALVGIPLIIAAIMLGGYLFFGFVVIVSGLALQEYYSLSRARGAQPQVITGMVFGVLFNAIFLYDKLHWVVIGWFHSVGIAIPFPSMAQLILITLLLFLPATLIVELFRNKPGAGANVSATVMGVLYVSLFFGALIGIRELFVPADFPVFAYFPVAGADVPAEIEAVVYRWGGWTVLAIFASIWVCDSAAYFAGRAFGKHKLFERVSPKKTWEGAIAGFIGATMMFLLMRALVLPYLAVGHAVVCGVVIGAFGQIGDLIESLLKRDAGVKDSSAILPGHGGLLDRFDSLLYVSPILFFYLDFIVF